MKIKLTLFFISVVLTVTGQNLQRNEINIPNIPGYVTLKCDFHIHTYFSDGEVLPRVRVREAWQEGLDAIAITDHIEYWRFNKGEYSDRNKPYYDALNEAQNLDIILIRSIELTKSMPPGHINLLFLEDVNKIDTVDYRKALKEAKRQNAFIFWNHPGWKSQAPDGAKWYDEHTEMFEKDWMNGIEIVNWDEWYPEVLDWAIEKNLTLIGNSDVHMPINDYLNQFDFEHRPMTMIFAKDRTQESMKEALLAGRTILWFNDLIIGRKKFAEKLIKESIKIKSIQNISENNYYVHIQNHSDFNFTISGINGMADNKKLLAGNTIRIWINSENSIEEVLIKFENVKTSSEEVLETMIHF